jgi:hypothetical protein
VTTTTINGRRYFVTSGYDYCPGWVDPIAIVLAVAGVGFGLILVTQAASRR